MAKRETQSESAAETSRPIRHHGATALVAGVLGWLIPGAGHVFLGRTRRGLIVFVCLATLFWGGIAMGGVMTVDRYIEPYWFLAQSMTGVHGLVGWYRQDRIYRELLSDPEIGVPPANMARPTEWQMKVDAVLAQRGIAVTTPTDGVARAYTGVAGMLNVLCVFDAVMLSLMGVHGEPKRRRTSKSAPAAGGEA